MLKDDLQAAGAIPDRGRGGEWGDRWMQGKKRREKTHWCVYGTERKITTAHKLLCFLPTMFA